MRPVDYLNKTKRFSLKCEGSSMFPILRTGDIVTYRKTPFSTLYSNDIVLIQKNNQLFTHRVIYKSKRHVVTKGDTNLASDGKVYPKQILGALYSIKRKGRIFHPDDMYLMQSSVYIKEILAIMYLFKSKGINYVFLKGLPLHLYFEKTHPRRIYADCDVLIDQQYKNMVEHILDKAGYKRGDSSFSKTQSVLQDREIETLYYKSIHGFFVVFDVHYEASFLIVHLGKLNALYHEDDIKKLTKRFLQNNQQVTIQNEHFPILDKGDFIIYLALHFFHHNFSGAFRLEFLDKVVRKSLKRDSSASLRFSRNDTDAIWEQIEQTILNYRLQNFVYPVFVLLKKYYKTPIPAVFFQSIKPKNPLTLKPVNSLTKTNIFDDEPRVEAGIRRFKNLFFLSPEPVWKKVFVFANLQVVYTIFWLLKRRLFSFFSRRQ